MQDDEAFQALRKFVAELLNGEYHDSPDRVFSDGRGSWTYSLPTEVEDVLHRHIGNIYVLKEFVTSVLTWQTHYAKLLDDAKPPGCVPCVFAIVELPVYSATVQLIYAPSKEKSFVDFYVRSLGELWPIRDASLTESVRLARPNTVSEIGFRYSVFNWGGIGFGSGEAWVFGNIPKTWVELWNSAPPIGKRVRDQRGKKRGRSEDEDLDFVWNVTDKKGRKIGDVDPLTGDWIDKQN